MADTRLRYTCVDDDTSVRQSSIFIVGSFVSSMAKIRDVRAMFKRRIGNKMEETLAREWPTRCRLSATVDAIREFKNSTMTSDIDTKMVSREGLGVVSDYRFTTAKTLSRPFSFPFARWIWWPAAADQPSPVRYRTWKNAEADGPARRERDVAWSGVA